MSKTLKKALVLILSCICLVSFAAGCDFFVKEPDNNEPTPPPAHTHTLEKVDAKLATCTESGTQSYYKCNGCDLIFSDAEGKQQISAPETIDALGHSYADQLTCHDRTCTRGCGHVEVATTDHVYVDGICGCQAVEPLDEMKIHLISQPSLGDSYLIQVDGVNILVDGNNRTDGTHNVAETQVIPFLQSQGVDKIDYLLITHPHDDHVGGLVDISEVYDIEQVWYYPIDFTLAQEGDFETGKQYLEEFLAVCEEKEIPLNIPTTEGQELAISENFTIKMYNLDILQNQKQNDNVNALGIIYLAEYYGKKVLFPGDTFSDGDEIISLPASAPSSTPVFEEIGDIDIMMAQHHGGTGCINTYPTFEALTPEYVFMSFPSPMDKSYTNGWYKLAVPTLTRCDLLQIPCYATGQSGDISITINELGEIDITSELEGDDLTPMKPPKQSSKVSSLASELTTDYYAIDVTFDRNMVADDQAETITSTTACWYFDGELMTEELGAYFAWNSEKPKTTLTFYVPIANYDAEATEHEFVITIDFASFNGICVNNDYSFKYNGTAWESQNIVTVTNVGDYGYNFNGSMKIVMFTFSSPVTNYTTATVVQGTTGILFNGVEIEGDYIQYCAPSGNTQMLLFIPKTLWDRGSQGIVITITKDFETENGFTLIKDTSYGYYESLGQWGLYTGDTFPETDPEVAEILEIANRGLTSAGGKYYDIKIYFTMNHGRKGQTFVFTEENDLGLKINGKSVVSTTDDAGGVIWGVTSYLSADGDNYYTFYLAENQVNTTKGLVFSIDKDTVLVEGGIKASIDLKWGENPSAIMNPAFGFTKFDPYTGDFSEFEGLADPDEGGEEVPEGKQEMLFGENLYAEKRYDSADGNLYYLLHWTVINPTLPSGYIKNSEMSELGVKINNEAFYSTDETPAWLTSTYTGVDPGNVFTIAIPAANIPNADIGVVITFPEHFKYFENDTYEFFGGSFYVTNEIFNSATTVWIKAYTGDFSEFATAE
ncbi:MAG: MBL fold metallo-hydrolase [Clostridiales bacterium]|nr:MBL fold metallo-hydrolase [Clostridiales bacterium]